jgi:hypothetical protein
LILSEPSYFGSVVLRCIPYFNMMIQRLIELKDYDELIVNFLEIYMEIFRFHDYPLTWISNMLLTSHDEISKSVKEKLLSVAVYCGLVSNQLKLEEDDYFFQNVKILSTFIPNAKNYQNSVMDSTIFNEFNSQFDLMFHSLIVEFLCQPLTVSEIVKKLMETLLKSTVSFDYIHTLCIVLFSLGNQSLNEIFEFSKQFLGNEKKISLLHLSLEENQMNCITGEVNIMLTFFHCLLSYGSSDCICGFISMLQVVEISSIEQLYFLCKVFAPFLKKYSSITNNKSKLVDMVTHLLLIVVRLFYNCFQNWKIWILKMSRL